MKFKLVSLTLAATILTPMLAAASTVNFTGEIVGSTCTVDSGSNNQTVALNRIDASELANDGDLRGHRNFDINLNCSASTEKVGIHFGSTSADPATGNLIPTGNATNVQIALFKGPTKQPINAGPTADAWTDVANGQMKLTYTAAYQAVGGAATEGNLAATSIFSVVYQ